MPVVRETLAFTLIVILVFVAGAVGILADADDYRYYSRITIENDGGTDITSPFSFTINAKSLSDAGWVQPDFEDIKLLSGSTEKYIVVTDTSATNAAWRMAWDTVSASSVINRYLWMGNTSATRNQVLVTTTSDSYTIADDASLDINIDLTIEGDFYFTETPTGTNYLIYKDKNYELTATSGTITFKIYSLVDPTYYLYPNGTGSLTQWANIGGAPTNWEAVLDTQPLGGSDATYVAESGAIGVYATDYYHLDNVDYGDVAFASLKVYHRGARQGTTTGKYYAVWLLNGTTGTGAQRTPAPAYTWFDYNDTMTRPGGGTWQNSDIVDLQIGVYGDNGASGDIPMVSEMYVAVTVDSVWISMPLETGTWQNIKGTFDGSSLNLYKNDILQSTTSTVPGGLATSGSPVYVAQFDGYCDNIRIGDTDTGTPTWQAEYNFEPLEIDDTTIEDVTSNTNTITYAWTVNPGNIEIDLDKITPYFLAYYTESGISAEDPEGIDIDFPSEPSNAYDDAGFNIIPGSGFINDQLDGAEIPRALFWYTLILLIVIGIGFFVFDKIRDIMATAIATAGAMIIGTVTEMGIGYVDIIAVAIVMIALYIRREHSTGRL